MDIALGKTRNKVSPSYIAKKTKEGFAPRNRSHVSLRLPEIKSNTGAIVIKLRIVNARGSGLQLNDEFPKVIDLFVDFIF